MKKQLLIIMLSTLIVVLAACGNDDFATKNEGNNNDANHEVETSATNNNEVEQPASTTLPTGFPEDFPFPDDITITEVMDNSEGSQKNFTIRFTFNPDMDLEPVFEMYESYRDKIGYESVLDGEEYFTDGIYQFSAMLRSSPSDMFIITMQPTDKTYGSIDLKYKE